MMLRHLSVARRCFAAAAATAQPQRVAKLVARTGAMSRREADAALHAGRITVNNMIASLGDRAPLAARIKLDGRALPTASRVPQVWLVYKMKGEAVAKAERGEKIASVFSRVRLQPHVCAVGRLDVQSEGLLVLTSCGELARAMELPQNELTRTYEVIVHGRVTPSKIAALRRGVRVEGVKYAPMHVTVADARDNRATLELKCREGKNRMIRRICDHLRLRVSRLRRVAFGPYSLRKHLPERMAIVEARIPPMLQRLVDAPAMLEEDAATPRPSARRPRRQPEGLSSRDALIQAMHAEDDDEAAAPPPRSARSPRRQSGPTLSWTPRGSSAPAAPAPRRSDGGFRAAPNSSTRSPARRSSPGAAPSRRSAAAVEIPGQEAWRRTRLQRRGNPTRERGASAPATAPRRSSRGRAGDAAAKRSKRGRSSTRSSSPVHEWQVRLNVLQHNIKPAPHPAPPRAAAGPRGLWLWPCSGP